MRKRQDGLSRGNNEIRSVCHSDRNQKEGVKRARRREASRGRLPGSVSSRLSKNNWIALRGAALSRIKFTFQPPLPLAAASLPAPTSMQRLYLSSIPSPRSRSPFILLGFTFPPPLKCATPRPPPCCLIFPSSFWNFQKGWPPFTFFRLAPAQSSREIPTSMQWNNKGTKRLGNGWEGHSFSLLFIRYLFSRLCGQCRSTAQSAEIWIFSCVVTNKSDL